MTAMVRILVLISWLHTNCLMKFAQKGCFTRHCFLVASPCYTSSLTSPIIQFQRSCVDRRTDVFILPTPKVFCPSDNYINLTWGGYKGMLFHISDLRETHRKCTAWTGCFIQGVHVLTATMTPPPTWSRVRALLGVSNDINIDFNNNDNRKLTWITGTLHTCANGTV